MLTVKELIEKLKEFNPEAKVHAIEPVYGHYLAVVDAEEECTSLVTLGLEKRERKRLKRIKDREKKMTEETKANRNFLDEMEGIVIFENSKINISEDHKNDLMALDEIHSRLCEEWEAKEEALITANSQIEVLVQRNKELKEALEKAEEVISERLESYNNKLPIGAFTEHGIYAGIAQGKQVWVAMNDAPNMMSWEEAMEYPKDGYHLPTKEELMLIYVNIDIINKALVDNGGEPLREYGYWSSTETSYSNSWLLYMNNGGIASYSKSYNYYVRQVVAF